MAFYDGYAENVTESVVETTQANSVSTGITGSVSTVITSTVQPTPNISCETFNNDCKGCVQNSQCYYCDENNECHFYILKSMVDGKCNMKHAYFHTCKLNLEVMLIIVGVLSGIAVLIILILCCYCCCKRKGIKISKDDLKWARQREERKQIAAERRKERAERTEEIRKKYGLVKDSNPYQKFDA